MDNQYHPVVRTIVALLTDKGVWFETFAHEAVRTSEEAAQVRTGYTIHQGAKALILRVKHSELGKHFVMVVIPGSARFATTALKNKCGFSDVRFATEGEVADITGGVLPGGVPPLGTLFNLPVYVEKTLLHNERIVFNAGDRRFSVAMRAVDYIDIVRPVILEIVE